MKSVKVLGTGCANCKATQRLIEEVAATQGLDIEMEKVEDMQAIMGYGVMSTPAVVVDGSVVHSGGLPAKTSIESWLA